MIWYLSNLLDHLYISKRKWEECRKLLGPVSSNKLVLPKNDDTRCPFNYANHFKTETF